MLKIKHTITFLSLLITSIGLAQSHFSLSVGGSYGFGIFENSVETFVNTKQEDNAYFSENKKFSLGGGLGVSANFIFHIQENFGFGLGITNHFNTEVEFVEINVVSGIISENTRVLSAKRFSFRPLLQVNTDFDLINTFVQIGVTFNATKQKLTETILVDTMETKLFWEYEGKSKMGFFAVWGLSYNLSDQLSINAGVSIEGFQYTPTHNYLQKMTKNSINVGISGLPEIYKSVEFIDWVSDQYSQYPDPNIPLQSPKQTFTYNNLAVFLNIAYRF